MGVESDVRVFVLETTVVLRWVLGAGQLDIFSLCYGLFVPRHSCLASISDHVYRIVSPHNGFPFMDFGPKSIFKAVPYH